VKTRIVIIGGGPSGLLLSQLLDRRGIDSVVLERKTRDYVLSRIRAGVLERGIVKLMEEAGCADRLHAEGIPHDGTLISYGDEIFRIDFAELTGVPVMVYGQTEVTRDLYNAREKAGGQIMFEVDNVEIHGADSDAPMSPVQPAVRHAGSIAISSPVATVFTASAARRSRCRCAPNTKRSTPSAGSAF
jgi:p-hydroxybenzoate 3-monooxygenase